MTKEVSQDEIVMTVFCSQGKNNFPITIKKGMLWEDAKKIVAKNGYNVDNMKAIESTKKSTLEHPKAVLPNEDFRLHLYPLKSKGGAKKEKSVPINRKEVSEKIKKHIIIHGDKAKKFFNEDKNFTNKSSEDLDTLLTKWEKKNGSLPEGEIDIPVKPKKVRATLKQSGIKHQDVSETLAEQAKETVADTPVMAIKTCIHLLKGISGFENQVDVEQAITHLQKAVILKPTPSEQEIIDREHRELASGLQGINY